ncbi:MAG: ABC transporter permease, partial [Bacteroidota bacterium]
MIRTYCTIASRHLLKEKFFSLINIMGLAIGIAVTLLIGLYISHELQYDRFHEKADRIYRIAMHLEMGGNATDLNSTFPPLAEAMQSDLPEIEHAIRLAELDGFFKYDDKVFAEENVLYADPDFFRVFSFTLLAGDKNKALEKPYQILLTPGLVRKYFDTSDYGSVVGKSIYVNQELHDITGVIADAPETSHMKFSSVISMRSIGMGRDERWDNMNVSTYVLLQPGASIQGIIEKIPAVVGKRMKNFDKMTDQGVVMQPFPQALTDIHLYSNIQGEFEPTSSMNTIYVFAAIALIVLLLACVNFVNLTTARSANRAKEVGVRKVLGSATQQLIRQFTFESILTVFVATLIGLCLVELMRYPFNEISGKQLSFDLLLNP